MQVDKVQIVEVSLLSTCPYCSIKNKCNHAVYVNGMRMFLGVQIRFKDSESCET